jgi:hypothetical protein
LVAVSVPDVAFLPIPGVKVTPSGRPDADNHEEDFVVAGVEETTVITKLVVDVGVVVPTAPELKTRPLGGVTGFGEASETVKDPFV